MIKRLLLVGLGIWTLLAPVAIVGGAMVMESSAEDEECQSGQIIAWGRRRWCGYFKNERNTSGLHVRVGGVPASVNRANDFITLIENDLKSSNAHRRTGAQFVILTMIGRGPGAPQSVSDPQLQDWKERVMSYASTSENGSQSRGPNGRIDWFVSMHTPCGEKNTYYQVPENDVAPYLDHAGNSNCEVASYRTNFILFRDNSGAVKYMIRRECMNPMGDLDGLDKPKAADYNLEPTVTTEVNGDISATAAEVGDTVRFIYRATNTGNDPSPNVNCTIYANVRAGYFATPSTPTSGNNPPGYSPPPTSCPKVFTKGVNQIATETITITTSNQTICRSLFVSPASPTVSSRGKEVCMPVANKPYARVFGGDISAGNGPETVPETCAANMNAAVVGWNKRAPGNFAGAGSQYAAFALNAIRDFASALGSPASANAQAPTGLSFANTSVNPGNGAFGGSFGSEPCMHDYYGDKPATTQAMPANFNAMITGNYAASGTVTLGGGVVDRNERIALFVDGDVFINGNIMFAGGMWDINETPSLRLIVRGNIYVSRTVTQLDGLFVAQANGSAGGNFYTCATSAAALPLNGSLYNTCLGKLTVNGAVVANQIHLLRTVGSLSQSNAGETNASTAAGEVINFGPALWLMQPQPPESSTPDYDAIISLPPIL